MRSTNEPIECGIVPSKDFPVKLLQSINLVRERQATITPQQISHVDNLSQHIIRAFDAEISQAISVANRAGGRQFRTIVLAAYAPGLSTLRFEFESKFYLLPRASYSETMELSEIIAPPNDKNAWNKTKNIVDVDCGQKRKFKNLNADAVTIVI